MKQCNFIRVRKFEKTIGETKQMSKRERDRREQREQIAEGWESG